MRNTWYYPTILLKRDRQFLRGNTRVVAQQASSECKIDISELLMRIRVSIYARPPIYCTFLVLTVNATSFGLFILSSTSWLVFYPSRKFSKFLETSTSNAPNFFMHRLFRVHTFAACSKNKKSLLLFLFFVCIH